VPVLLKPTPKSYKKIPWAPISMAAVSELTRTIMPSDGDYKGNISHFTNITGGVRFWNTVGELEPMMEMV
jgi:hypothetical protein